MGLVPLFPLNTVVFPGMTVPLYVFEERYKRLVKASLKGEPGRFVMILAGTGADALAPVGTFVDILTVNSNPDGTFHLLVHGRERCRIEVAREELVTEVDGSSRQLLFSRPVSWPLRRDDPNEERLLAWDAVDTFQNYAATFFAYETLEKIDKSLPADPVYQASFICANIRVPLDERQSLLEAESLSERLRLAVALMERRLAAHRTDAESDA